MKKPYLINIEKVGMVAGCECVSISFHNSLSNQRDRKTYYKRIGKEYRKLYSDEVKNIR